MIRSLVLVLMTISFTVLGQGSQKLGETNCGFDGQHRAKLGTDTRYSKVTEAIEQQIVQFRQECRDGNMRLADETYTIPVVVHIVHNGGEENISDQQVKDGISHLNEAFSKMAVQYTGPNGVVIGIEFCLAKQDPNGAFTTGINRVVSGLTNVDKETQDQQLKNLIRWDAKRYLNIWLVKEICGAEGCGVAGYAYMAAAHGQIYDGIVNEARSFGSNRDNSKIHIHEVGHYLDLYHTFEGGCTNNDCEKDGDKVCDTPPDQSTAALVCSATANTCHSDADDQSSKNPFRPIALGGKGDQNDMIENYMDYGFQICQNTFTAGQKERMIAALTKVRWSLLESDGCKDNCPVKITPSFNASATNVTSPTNVIFTNTSTGATSYTWQINGVNLSNTTNASYLFIQQGTHTVKLIASNANASCTKEYSIPVKVNCQMKATFSGTEQTEVGAPVTFASTAVGAISWQWFVNGQVAGTGSSYTHTFNAIGGYLVNLVAYNGACYDTSMAKVVNVGSCAGNGKRAFKWIFGFASYVDFSSGSPLNKALPWPAAINVNSQEGSTSMADANGNLLFYSNGMQVLNKNVAIMPNGADLMGGSSSMQVMSIAKPGSEGRYYVFTTDHLGQSRGMRYSEVDMSLEGGLGDVIAATKNTLLFTPSTEKMTAVRHVNGVDMWFIGHEWNSDAFYVYLVSASGVSANPVISNVGGIHKDYSGQGSGTNAMGALKASPDGCKLALTTCQTGFIQMLKFNNQTGAVSEPVTITEGYPAGDFRFIGSYGVEFSPNGTKLYISVGNNKPEVYQFDLSTGSAANILASATIVGTDPSAYYGGGGLQLGPDGHIYHCTAARNYLNIIKNPDQAGLACNMQINAFTLPQGASHGLPTFVQSYFDNPKPVISGPSTMCSNNKKVVYNISNSGCSSYIISWRVTGKGKLVSSTDAQAEVDFEEEGKAWVIVQKVTACGTTSDTIEVLIQKTPTGVRIDTVLCSQQLLLNAGNGYQSYSWNSGYTNQQWMAVAAPGKYWVEKGLNGCQPVVDTVYVKQAKSLFGFSLGKDTIMCAGKAVTLNGSSGYAAYQWSNKSLDFKTTVYQAGKYWLTVTNQCGFKATDTIKVTTKGLLLDLGNDKVICNTTGSNVELDAGAGFTNYLWSDNSRQQKLTATAVGKYWVIASDAEGCFGVDTVSISEKSVMSVDLGGDQEICTGGNTILLNAGSGFQSYLWNDGSDQQTLVVAAPGKFWVKTKDQHGCEAVDTVLVSPKSKITVNLGPDKAICPASEKVLLIGGEAYMSYLWNTGSVERNLTVTEPGSYILKVTDVAGCSDADTVVISIRNDCDPVSFVPVSIPNAFSPNSDGLHDVFEIRNINYYPQVVLTVFNQWGRVVFKSPAGYPEPWNGNDLSVGTYYYILDFNNGKTQSVAGYVTLLK